METRAEILSKDSVRFERDLPGPIERVWEYIVNPAKRVRWLCGGETELKVGGRVLLAFDNSLLSGPDDGPPPAKHEQFNGPVTFPGRVTRFEPPTRFAHTWEFEGQASEVLYELQDTGAGVHLVLTHTRLSDDEEKISVCSGWHTHLGILADVLADRPPRPFWTTHTALEAEYAAQISG